ncbi:response regulator transcription factor [Cohnella hashimotonis]|uniref:Response regulator n=1 Tax=Cohnella hashimotonis TaxID=2826895 RepID=A0ABT6TT83_9BACL|nr:response regulator [Cohnella hashimotonis]MDI4650068.1 response regulator [Cohnella hashimotonis]
MKMTVVVIDDKPLILQSIVRTVDWERLGCTVVGQAMDGVEGKRVIDECRPDLLITDIKIPGVSGLELAAHMHTELPYSKTILITGYQDFEFAKRAVSLGVKEIVVKPIRNDELERVIGQAVDEIAGEREETSRRAEREEAFSRLTERHQSSLPTLRSKLVSELIAGGGPDRDELAKTAAELGVTCSRCAVVIVRSKRASGAARGDGSQRIDPRLRDEVAALARAAADKRDFETIDGGVRDDLALACLFPKPLTPRELRMKLQSFCHDLVELARERRGLSCCMAVSQAYKRLEELGEAFAEASALMETSFFRTEEPVLLPAPDESGTESGRFAIVRDLETFNRMLEQSTAEEMGGHLERFLERVQLYSEGNIRVAKGLLSEICLAAARYYYRTTGDELGFGKSIDEMLEDVYRLADMKEASEYVAALIRTVKDKLDGGDKDYSLVVKKSIDYINAHFAETISLTSLADHFGLSSGYLSRLLRAETGINFVDLVVKARIEAAKRLLRDPRLKVNEVGETVGYKEYAYFYQVFKKVEGVSPKEYKNRSE